MSRRVWRTKKEKKKRIDRRRSRRPAAAPPKWLANSATTCDADAAVHDVPLARRGHHHSKDGEMMTLMLMMMANLRTIVGRARR